MDDKSLEQLVAVLKDQAESGKLSQIHEKINTIAADMSSVKTSCAAFEKRVESLEKLVKGNGHGGVCTGSEIQCMQREDAKIADAKEFADMKSKELDGDIREFGANLEKSMDIHWKWNKIVAGFGFTMFVTILGWMFILNKGMGEIYAKVMMR